MTSSEIAGAATAVPPEDDASAAACQVCGGGDRAALAGRDGWQAWRCATCGLGYLDPMPGAADIGALYDDAYAGATTGYFAKSASKMRRARRRTARIARLAPPGDNAHFLDVGCNAGYTVEAARLAGYHAHGIELDPVSYRFAKVTYPDNDFFNGPVETYAPGVKFDAVYCAEVIEHVPAVDRFVAAIAALMHPRAILYLTTPDLGHWRTPRDVAAWSAFTPPGHCLFFTYHSLSRLLARHGLSIVKRQLALKPGLKIFARKST